MAHKKGGGSSKNGRDSNAQRLGVKRYGGQHLKAGEIIARQHGTKIHPGTDVGLGRDHTLFAKIAGILMFKIYKGKKVAYMKPVEAPAEKA